jgi:hypothetical protein
VSDVENLRGREIERKYGMTGMERMGYGYR